jgi:hypothetical protein
MESAECPAVCVDELPLARVNVTCFIDPYEIRATVSSNCDMEPMKVYQVNVNLPCAPFKAFAQGRFTGATGVREVPQTTISRSSIR